MRDIYGNWVWEGDIETGSSGKVLKLGCDHSAYQICIRQNELTVHQWGWLTYADYWGIECVSNCEVCPPARSSPILILGSFHIDEEPRKESCCYKSHPSQTLAVWLRIPINNSLCVNHKSRL